MINERSVRAFRSKVGYITIFFVLAIFMINIVVSCSSSTDITIPPVPTGQVKGNLSFKAEFRDPEVIMLGIIKEGGHYGFDLKWQSVVEYTGSIDHDFYFEDVPPGEYCLLGFYEENGMISIYILVKDSEVYTFTVPEDRGINLGYIGFFTGQEAHLDIIDEDGRGGQLITNTLAP